MTTTLTPRRGFPPALVSWYEHTTTARRLGVIAPCPDFWGKMRHTRGWTQAQLMTRLEHAAASLGQHLPDRDSMQIQISRWENGKVRMGGRYERLFRTVYDLTDDQPTTPRSLVGAR